MANWKCKIEAKVGDNVYKSGGKDLFDAFKKLKVKEEGVLTGISIDEGGEKSEVPIKIYPLKLRRLLANDWEKEIFVEKLKVLK